MVSLFHNTCNVLLIVIITKKKSFKLDFPGLPNYREERNASRGPGPERNHEERMAATGADRGPTTTVPVHRVYVRHHPGPDTARILRPTPATTVEISQLNTLLYIHCLICLYMSVNGSSSSWTLNISY